MNTATSAAEGVAENGRELVAWADRKGQLPDLVTAMKKAHPTIDLSSLDKLPPPQGATLYHHIPFHRNDLFTGRQEILTKLHGQLASSTAANASTTCVVVGLGGVGKTQVALAYCYRHLADYDLIHWLRADDATLLGLEMAEMAYRLGLAPRSVTDQNALQQQVQRWLQTTARRWLLVFDNADSIDPAALLPFLPKLGNGASLITSRNPNWGGLAPTLRLDLFTEAEAVDFLLTPRLVLNVAEELVQSRLEEQLPRLNQSAQAAYLAQLLGRLPLALEHARAYIAATGCSLADYTGYFETEREELWAEADAPVAYEQKTIATTWEMAFGQIQQTSGAAALLNLCTFFAPDEIPLSFITDLPDSEELPADLAALAKSKRRLDQAIAALRRFSLLSRDGDLVSIHPLVQLVARDRMPPAVRKTWLMAAVEVMDKAWSFDALKMETWEKNGRLLPHLLATIAAATIHMIETTTVASLNSKADYYLSYLGNLAAARLYSERALTIDEKVLGSEHPTVARDLNNLGQLLQALGDFEAARPLMERALVIDEKALGSDHPDVAIDLNNLGQLLQTLGKFTVAQQLLERALAIDEKASGPYHPNVARDLNNLGSLLQALGNYEVAQPFLERALAIDEKALGSNHPDVARDLNNLGSLLQALGDYEAAQPFLERALAISEKVLGPDHPPTAIRLNNLGLLLKALGDYTTARAFLERALAIDEKALSLGHPSVARDLNNLGQLLQALGDFEAARPLMERALAILEAKLGESHPNSNIVRKNLARLLAEMAENKPSDS